MIYNIVHCLCLVFLLLLINSQARGARAPYCSPPWHRRHAKARPVMETSRTFVVDKSGQGNFSSIQDAINIVPSDNKEWVCIYVKADTYREQVKIPYDKPFIIIKGEGKRKTSVIWDAHESLAQSPTFMSLADNIVVKCISFVNAYNIPWRGNPRTPAVAAMITGDKSAFYRCGFLSVQDTIWDDQGRHYFHKCTVQGAVDFIFGSGQSIYEGCAIQVLGNQLEAGLPGFITAQGRTNPNDGNGFVFKNCNVFGFGSAYLGRPWRDYSRVLFYNSNFTEVVQPKGWDASNFVGKEYQLSFSEHDNYGPGANNIERVSWEKKLALDEVNQLTSMDFINREGWLEKQPF